VGVEHVDDLALELGDLRDDHLQRADQPQHDRARGAGLYLASATGRRGP
jgi:hypothetical protein